MGVERARQLRQNATDVERRLWQKLRSRQFERFKFRRQRPIGPYIVDFVCLERGLVIELDGGQHEMHRADDERRDAYLHSAGYRVLRFWNNDVTQNLDGVLQAIDAALRLDPHPGPLPQAGEGDKRMRAKHKRMVKMREKISAQTEGMSAANPLPLAGEGRVRVGQYER